jgi:hypothetical protein
MLGVKPGVKVALKLMALPKHTKFELTIIVQVWAEIFNVASNTKIIK